MKKFKSWGEIGEANGKVEINFSDPEFTISADLSLLGSEKAKAAAKINKDGLDVSASVELGISGFGCEVKGKADANLGGNLTGGYIKLGVMVTWIWHLLMYMQRELRSLLLTGIGTLIKPR